MWGAGMKKKKLDLKSLKTELEEIEKQIQQLEDECDNYAGKDSYMGGRRFDVSEIVGSGHFYHENLSHSHGLMMTDCDYIELDIRDLKKRRDLLQKQIKEIEEENAPAGLGG